MMQYREHFQLQRQPESGGKRAGQDVAFVIWGNAEPGLLEAWGAVIQGCAGLGGSEVG